AHARFQEKGERPIACLQARLNCYNRNRNWLTRLFALDYALWFDFMLPGLERMGLPLPLGGTSNHFRVSVLRHVHAWDAWNVTEDADLGLRLMRHGHRIATLDSTTFEEAAETLGPWLRQRARWLKGYLITFLVHMRVPGRALMEFGAFGVLGLVFFIGGSVLTALVNPVFWILWIIWAATGTNDFHFLFGGTVEGLALFSMIAGNLGCLVLWLIAPMRRGWMELAPWALTAPLYWLLISAAGWLALYDFIARPFHWHKTPHGASAASAGAP
ncbi:MAG TPA: glycosyltransferase family 2 protein, partial [Micropepsaceae bacterium]|nr:glycosyltransferase family 2 protein [Micropepsaceae bacterium]